MVQLLETDVATKEVLNWSGLHVFHYDMSSCSQKLRIYLSYKGLDWHSHPIDIAANEHLTPFYLGINPRGLLPSIVDDGTVHIESNDIILHLERRYPERSLMPIGMEERAAMLLKHEDEMHLDLRSLTFRFLFDPTQPTKSSSDLDRFASMSSRRVRGTCDHAVEREIAFWSGYLSSGISDAQVRMAASRLHAALTDVDEALTKQAYVCGSRLSIIDIAWLVYVRRLIHCGYPVRQLHSRVDAWQTRLMQEPAIARELTLPEALTDAVARRQSILAAEGRTLVDVCFPQLAA